MSEVLLRPVAKLQRPRRTRRNPYGYVARKLAVAEHAVAGVLRRGVACAVSLSFLARPVGPARSVTAAEARVARYRVAALAALLARRRGLSRGVANGAARSAMAVTRGRIAVSSDSDTREAALAVAAAELALVGHRVHVLCVSAAEAHELHSASHEFFELFDLSAAAVAGASHLPERRADYQRDIVFVDTLQIATDHLRDIRDGLHTRGGARYLSVCLADGSEGRRHFRCGPLDAAIVTDFHGIGIEASARPIRLLDERRLIGERKVAGEAIALARRLKKEDDFEAAEVVALTARGRIRLARLALAAGPLWAVEHWREATIRAALWTLHFARKHADYTLRQGLIEFRSPEDAIRNGRGSLVSLEALIEAKERTEPNDGADIVDEISVRRFLSRYRHLSGVSAPAFGLSAELWGLYSLTAVRATSRLDAAPSYPGLKVHRSEEEKWSAVEADIRDASAAGMRCMIVGSVHSQAAELASKISTQFGYGFDAVTRLEEIRAVAAGQPTVCLFVEVEDMRHRQAAKEIAALAVAGARGVRYHISRECCIPGSPMTGRDFGPVLRVLPAETAMRIALRRVQARAALRARAHRRRRLRWENSEMQAFAFVGERRE